MYIYIYTAFALPSLWLPYRPCGLPPPTGLPAGSPAHTVWAPHPPGYAAGVPPSLRRPCCLLLE